MVSVFDKFWQNKETKGSGECRSREVLKAAEF